MVYNTTDFFYRQLSGKLLLFLLTYILTLEKSNNKVTSTFSLVLTTVTNQISNNDVTTKKFANLCDVHSLACKIKVLNSCALKTLKWTFIYYHSEKQQNFKFSVK